ncbi:MAG: cellulase family glycosylhydrolase [Acidobacteria bacterium]|nr:cellulase family glycosylhydrolase [Acidobacteriota bacterium]
MRLPLIALCLAGVLSGQSRWSEKAAKEWYAKEPWLVGSNYIPAGAINQLEMWQQDTFDPLWMETELTWGEKLGMNTMRVFLHDLLWKQDPTGFRHRIDKFLSIADAHGIRPIFVLFDSCWDPYPQVGPQRPPKPGVHNSGWVQSPGAASLQNPADYDRLRQYVQEVIGAYRYDKRVLAWDLWNEPDNTNDSSYGKLEPANKVELVKALLPQVFAWARAMEPAQPLTSGVWKGDWSSDAKLSAIEKIQLDNSDVISFHDYGKPAEFEARIRSLERYNRPIFCTEYMARGNGSTFEGSLPIAKKYKVAAINWGFVAGKTQTYLPWDSWQHPYVDREPAVWFHDIFHKDGTPYRADEVSLIRSLTEGATGKVKGRKGKGRK